jgi:Tfp pilus assembly protein PilF
MYFYTMKPSRYFFVFIFLFVASQNAFSQTAKELQESARAFLQQGDYANALMILNRATQAEPQNIDITKDLALTYYLQKDNLKALEIIKPVLDREDVDDQCFQIAGNIYKQLQNPKDCDKLYRKGLKKFPQSGPLYNDLGELLWAQQDYSAIKQWEKGIEEDPAYSKNYYNACKYYFLTTDKVWSILYGEIFANMEPTGSRTPEIKAVLSESYKKLFAEADLTKNVKDKNKFETAFVQTMNKQTAVAILGINPETLSMIRARFILDWDREYAAQFPFRLFEQQRQLLQEGTFDAYNQWLFGSVQNLAAYQTWTTLHASEYSEFSRFQKGRVFKIPSGQYYRY